MMRVVKQPLAHAAAACLLAVILSACETGPPAPQAGPPVPLGAYPDLSYAAGRVICLDPGHGGPWPGAVAPSNGLRESDVNLAVALRTRALLEAAGAEVVLTREGDEVFFPEDAGSDLSARPALANQIAADVFVSIHHNADINPASGRDDLEVYYRLYDEGPSMDLGQHMLYALGTWMRQDAQNKLLLPGNYRVLREAEVPAVLLESAYMSHAPSAARLATREGIEQEARAIAGGLALYFSTDPPRAADSRLARDRDGRYVLATDFEGGLPLDLDSLEVRVNGKAARGSAEQTQSSLEWSFAEPLPNGALSLRIRGRNQRGAYFVHELIKRVARPAARLTVRQHPALTEQNAGAVFMFEVAAEDEFGLPVADGTIVRGEGITGNGLTSQGKARFYAEYDAIPERLRFTCAAAETAWTPLLNGPAMRTLRCIDGETREPLAGVEAVGAGAEGSTPEGWLAVPAELDRVALSREGYHGAVVVPGGRHAVVAMRPMLEGALHGRRIIVDPAGGPGGESTEAAEKNFEAAERLYHLLKAAGADAALTRGPNENPDRIERLLLTRGAELFLQVSYGEASGLERLLAASGYRREAPGAFVGHYPNSANGERMARHAAERLGGLPTTPSVSYLIQQTPCPAVLIRPAGEQSAEDAARGLYEAIALYYGVKSPR